MTQLQVELRRDGQPLGMLPVGEIPALLEARFLRPTDEFRTSETVPWKALAQFPGQPSTAPASLAERIKVAVAKATKPAGQLIGHVSAKATGLKNAPRAGLSRATEKGLGDYLPHLQEMTLENLARLQGAGHTALRDGSFCGNSLVRFTTACPGRFIVSLQDSSSLISAYATVAACSG